MQAEEFIDIFSVQNMGKFMPRTCKRLVKKSVKEVLAISNISWSEIKNLIQDEKGNYEIRIFSFHYPRPGLRYMNALTFHLYEEYNLDMEAVSSQVFIDKNMILTDISTHYDGPGESDPEEFYNYNKDRTHLVLDIQTNRKVLTHLGYCSSTGREQFLELVAMLRENEENILILYSFLDAYTSEFGYPHYITKSGKVIKKEYDFDTRDEFMQFAAEMTERLEPDIEQMIEKGLSLLEG